MKIYTRTGDAGKTSLYGGKRISKANLQIEASGSLDELSSFIGFAMTKITSSKHIIFLTEIQKDLHLIMSYLAGYSRLPSLFSKKISVMERLIDSAELKLTPIHKFILPQGNKTTALFHITRSVCRRAERNVVVYFNHLSKTKKEDFMVLSYLNRLSDVFFVFARLYNKKKEILV